MKWLNNLIRAIAREEIETMVTSKEYITMIKTSLHEATEQKRVNENEEYIRDMRD